MAGIGLSGTDEKIEALVRQGIETDEVVEWWHELGVDSHGDPAVWIWLVVPDRAVEEAREKLLEMSDRIEELIRGDGRYWPFVYFRSKSEQEALRPETTFTPVAHGELGTRRARSPQEQEDATMAPMKLGGTDPKIEALVRERLDPEKVLEWWYELGADAYGDPGVWVWLVIPDEAVETQMDPLLDMSERIEDAIKQDGRYWPYTNFRSKTEQEALRT